MDVSDKMIHRQKKIHSTMIWQWVIDEAWVGNYTPLYYMDVNTYPYPNPH